MEFHIHQVSRNEKRKAYHQVFRYLFLFFTILYMGSAMKTYSLLLIFVFGFILLSGCAKQETDSYAKSYYDIYLANPLAIYNASQVGSCNPGS